MKICPECKSEDVIGGGINSVTEARFQPMRMQAGSESLAFIQPFLACKKCGLVWSRIKAEDLPEFLKRNCMKS
jgi:hypothetical protein